jgi:hypothetical protein
MDEGPNLGENEELGPFFPVRMKKKGAGGLAWLVAGDALIGLEHCLDY